MTPSNVVRLFVSSTFSDLAQERDALQRFVFPRLRELARARGRRFQAIDLRWGVSEEAALNQQTMGICLGEIQRCQEQSPRPNFLVLLGERYGWRPLPAAIPAEELQRMLPLASPWERSMLLWREGEPAETEGWYRLDDNARPSEYVLRPRSGRFEDYAVWEREVERPLVAALERLALRAGLPEEALAKYRLSATGQEIVRGAFAVPDAREHVFCFFRTIENGAELPVEARRRYFEDDGALGARQLELRAALAERLPGNIVELGARWRDGLLTADHIGSLPEPLAACLALGARGEPPRTLCEAVWLRLSRLIMDAAAEVHGPAAPEREERAHRAFATARSVRFLGRDEPLKRIADYLSGAEPHPLLVSGPPGSGKSALMARALHAAECSARGEGLVSRFIGATPESSDARSLLEGLCRQIADIYQEDESGLPRGYGELTQSFPKLLALATAACPLVIFLDAVDECAEPEAGCALPWIPETLPPHVRLIVSCLPGPKLDSLRIRLAASSGLEVPAMSETEGAALLDLWLRESGRRLTEAQRRAVVDAFAAGGGLPLRLKLAFEEARRWHSYDPLPVRADGTSGIGVGTGAAMEELFRRLELQENHGPALVRSALAMLVAARNGLGEDEMLDLLSRDVEVMGEFRLRSPKSPEHDRLPVVLWSRLYADLEPYLVWREADGAPLLGFYHRQLRAAAERRYFPPEKRQAVHARLAAYFGAEGRGFWIDRAARMPDRRACAELPFQLGLAGKGPRLAALLSSFEFVRASIFAAGVQRIVEEYGEALERAVRPPGEDATSPWVPLLKDCLRRSAHVLERDPDRLAERLWGSLAGASSAELRAMLDAAMAWTEEPWLRPVAACFAPTGDGELRSLAGHGGAVNAVAIAPDGRTAVSASSDATLKVWDLDGGTERYTLAQHRKPVRSLALSPDGRLAISFSGEPELCIWDLASGRRTTPVVSHAVEVTAFALAPDGRRLVSAINRVTPIDWEAALASDGDEDPTREPNGEDYLIKVWDLESRREHSTLVGHLQMITALAVSPDSHRLLSASYDRTVRLWDLDSSRELRAFARLRAAATLLVYSSDGRFALAGAGVDLLLFDLATASEPRSLGEGGAEITAIALSPGGRLAAAGLADGTVHLWDVAASGGPRALRGHGGAIAALAFASEGRRLLSASADKSLRLWNLDSSRNLDSDVAPLTIVEHAGEVSGFALSRDERFAVTASADATLKVVSLEGALVRGHSGLPKEVVSAAIARGGGLAALGAADGGIHLVDFRTGEAAALLSGRTVPLKLAFCAGDTKLVAASEDGAIDVWDLGSERVAFGLRGALFDIVNEGSTLHIVAEDGGVEAWDAESGGRLSMLPPCAAGQELVALSPDGLRRLVRTAERRLVCVDAGKTGELLLLERFDRFARVAVSPELRRAFVGGPPLGTLALWDLDRGAQLARFPSAAGTYVLCIAVGEGGRLAATAGDYDNFIKVWDLERESQLKALYGPRDPIVYLGFSPDGRVLYSCTLSGQWNAWDCRRRLCLAAFAGPSGFRAPPSLSRDGSRVVLLDRNGRPYLLALENLRPS